MNSSYILALVALCFCLVSAQQQGIPKTYPGYKQGNADAPVVLEAFLDFQCPFCAAAWPTCMENIPSTLLSREYYI